MSCDEVRVALPILPDGDADEAARIRAHCAACSACGELLAGHESDASLLAAVRAGRDAAPPPAALNDFTASVLARVAAEREAAPRSGTLIAWPGALRAAAAAAAVLLGVAVGLRGGSQASPVVSPGEVASRDPVATAPGEPLAARDPLVAPAPSPATSTGEALVAAEPLAAPVRDQAPTPRRRRARPGAGRDIVPVGETGGRQVLPPGMLPGGLFEDLERILPELQRRMERRQAGDGVREVKF